MIGYKEFVLRLFNESLNEKIKYKFKNDYQKNRFENILDKIHDAKIGDILDNEDIYLFVEYLTIMADKFEESFVDGNLGERLEEYDKYILKEIPLSDIDLNEWDVDYEYVVDYQSNFEKTKEYPPIVVDSELSIIDGIHRANALKQSGETKILSFVGIE